ncbi:MAG: methylated-DNA--[protein]-cysteine S-methyltransferase [Acidobacteriota bacterium]
MGPGSRIDGRSRPGEGGDGAALAFDSPIGRLRVTATDQHVVGVKLNSPPFEGGGGGAALRLCERAQDEILAYLDGELREFSVPFRLIGRSFLRRAMSALLDVAYSETITYGQLARRLNAPGSSRAIGAACGANPLPLVVPCHRVLAAEGLGGFGGGLEMKRWLLELEATGKPPKPRRGGPSFDTVAGEQARLF